ncbi:MAG: NACHT domain-containing NTPase [Gomphosphaeria aponina SAG 52.96 = DSM 107014]|uniref:NACHT domain-containing NTPase n=1 Tax=Gomphosphaeria aponina SAG 52.96 = DSM 107014 TaxID=1521640 RepID=A0A941GW26_9CHRO|nr:NACHT domain-containing NTPase [Gomphosphaeria aponina SAG 52.96 = DSM 107014]
MAKRSIKASETGIAQAKQRFERTGWTQEYLATEVGLSTRQSIWKFFTGRPIERHLFIEICFKLDLKWEEIADLPEIAVAEKQILRKNKSWEVEQWVLEMRSQLQPQIETQCGTLQSSLEITQPLYLEQVYTNVNIIPQLTNERWLEVEDLQKTPRGFNRLMEERETILGMEIVAQHCKLMILGKPGCGKSTFLQNIALECIQGFYKSDCIPIFIQLGILVIEGENEEQFSLFNYLKNLGLNCGLSQEQVKKILESGKVLLLLDGLDEVSLKNKEEIVKEIDKFAQVYLKNQIIITSRIGAQQYYFRGFNYVEIADFNQAQVETFVQKWFMATAKSKAEGLNLAEQFLQQLDLQANLSIRDLVITPILLNLICSVFKERAIFPTKRAKIYQIGLDILLVRWDLSRGVMRDEIYCELSLPDKIKLLCEIAATNLAAGNYFFEKSELIYIIEEYLGSLPNGSDDPETLWLNGEAVLKSLQIQHGLLVEQAREIYSFSHLTFQEYLTARKFVATPPQFLHTTLSHLGSYALDNRWREVIILTVSMLPRADFLLQEIKKQVDGIVELDGDLANFLSLINQKVESLKVSRKKAAVRAFYLTLFEENRDLNLATSIDENFVSNLCEELALDLALARIFAICLNLGKNPKIEGLLNLFFALDLENRFQLAAELKVSLKNLKEQLPDWGEGIEKTKKWWEKNGENWAKQLRLMLIEQRQIGHHWQRSEQQQELWQKYYHANLFLVECLKSECHVSPQVRSEIEANLLFLNPQKDC